MAAVVMVWTSPACSGCRGICQNILKNYLDENVNTNTIG